MSLSFWEMNWRGTIHPTSRLESQTEARHPARRNRASWYLFTLTNKLKKKKETKYHPLSGLCYDIWITFRSRQRLVHYISTLSNDQLLSSGVTHSIKVKVSSFLFDWTLQSRSTERDSWSGRRRLSPLNKILFKGDHLPLASALKRFKIKSLLDTLIAGFGREVGVQSFFE